MPEDKKTDQNNERSFEPEIRFKAMSDLTVLSVINEDTNDSLFEITGYGLDVKFNRDLIHSLADVENLLDGIKDMFRKVIMKDFISDQETQETK